MSENPEGGLLDSLKSEVTSLPEVDAFTYDALRGLMESHPEAAKELISRKYDASRDFIQEDGKIDYDALHEQLTLEEKFSLLYSMFLSDLLGENFLGLLTKDTLGAKQITMEDMIKELQADTSSAAKVIENNIVFPSADGIIGKFRRILNLSDVFLDKKQEGNEAFRVVVQSTMVVPRNPDLKISRLTQFRHAMALLKPPVKVSVFSSNEKDIKAPGANEINFVYVPEKGLPDKASMENLVKLFDQGNVQWFSPDVVAGVYVMKGLEPDKALKLAGIGNADELLRSQLQDLVPKESDNEKNNS